MEDEHGVGVRSTAVSTSNELSGVVHGPTVQAGAIHGDVHIHRTGPACPPTPRQVPAPSAYFVSRDAELAELDSLVDSGVTLAVLCGPAGVGKTALVTYWTHRVRDRFPDGQLYVDLAGFSDGSRWTRWRPLAGSSVPWEYCPNVSRRFFPNRSRSTAR